jgi:hypothetical protein
MGRGKMPNDKQTELEAMLPRPRSAHDSLEPWGVGEAGRVRSEPPKRTPRLQISPGLGQNSFLLFKPPSFWYFVTSVPEVRAGFLREVMSQGLPEKGGGVYTTDLRVRRRGPEARGSPHKAENSPCPPL